MSNRAIRWLHDELPGLVVEGVLDEAAAARLRSRYQEPRQISGMRLAIIVCSLFGALLIGVGVIEDLFVDGLPVREWLASDGPERPSSVTVDPTQ